MSIRSVEQENMDLKEQLQGTVQEIQEMKAGFDSCKQFYSLDLEKMKAEVESYKQSFFLHMQEVQDELDSYKKSYQIVLQERNGLAEQNHRVVQERNGLAEQLRRVVQEKNGLEDKLHRSHFDCQQCKVLKKEVDSYKMEYLKVLEQIKDLRVQLQGGSIHRLMQKVFKDCDKCTKLQQTVDSLTADNTRKDEEIQRFCIKMNADFGHHQGNSMEVEDMKRLWDNLFLYEVESGVTKGDPQINVIRRVYCDMFMTIRGCVQNELITRMADCFTALFIPGRLENSKISLKEVERAFSILVTIPKVQQEFKLSPKVIMDFQKIAQDYNLKNMDHFVQSALSLCVSMSARVPPYIISNDDKQFVPEKHEPKYVKGAPHLQTQSTVSYLRPTVYYNYQGRVCFKGLVVGSTLVHKLGDTCAAIKSAQQPSEDGQTDDELATHRR